MAPLRSEAHPRSLLTIIFNSNDLYLTPEHIEIWLNLLNNFHLGCLRLRS